MLPLHRLTRLPVTRLSTSSLRLAVSRTLVPRAPTPMTSFACTALLVPRALRSVRPLASSAPVPPPASSATVATAAGATATATATNPTDEKKQRPKISRSDLQRLMSLARPELPLVIGGTVCLAAAAAVTMYQPLAFGGLIDRAIAPGASDSSLLEYAQLLAGLFAAGGVASWARMMCFSVAGNRLVRRLRANVFERMMGLDTVFFDRHRTGDMLSRLSADSDLVGRTLTGPQLSQGLRSLAQAVAGTGYMLYLSPALTAVVAAVMPFIVGGGAIYGRYVKKLSERVQAALARTSAVAEERLAGIRTVRAFAQERNETRRFGEAVEELYRLSVLEAKATSTFFASAKFGGDLALLSVLGYGGHLVLSGQLTAGVLTSFLMYGFMVGASAMGLSTSFGEVMKALGASRRLFEVLDEPRMVERAAAPSAITSATPTDGAPSSSSSSNDEELLVASPERPTLRFRGAVRFEDVHFAYPTRASDPVFRGLSLSIPAGSSMAVVGASGSGKSTLAALILRLYSPESGRVLVSTDEGFTDAAEVDPRWLRRHVGVVSQEPTLFATSIYENILYGNPNATRAQVEEAARQANAYAFIQSFPEGFDTQVGERGVSLSGGQKQRIAIARALLRDPELLVLDEATSALDAESESAVQEAMVRLMRGRTTIVIAHRLSTVRNADAIAVLDDGRVAELGRHEELMARPDGLYRNLMEKQAGALLG